MRRHILSAFHRCSLVHIATLFALIGSGLFVTSVHAAGLVVNSDLDFLSPDPSDGLCTLREAITNANDDAATSADCSAGSGTDIITFAGDYTITLQSRQLPIITTEMTIRGNGADKTIIQADASPNVATYRVFHVGLTGTLTLDQVSVRNGRCVVACVSAASTGGGILNRGTLTVTNSTLSGNSAEDEGGAIYNLVDTLTITNSTLSDNTAVRGGAIYIHVGTPLTITNSTFSDNTALAGGAIYNHAGTLRVNSSTFSGNSARSGGGIVNHYYLAVTDSVFSGNSADYGGGINSFAVVSTAIVTGSTFSGNSADLGGGIYAFDDAELMVANSSFSGNSAIPRVPGNTAFALGGGIYANKGITLTITDSTFNANTAGTEGGGLYFLLSDVDLRGDTFSANTAATLGGGVRGVQSGNVTIANSTFSANTAATGGGLDLLQSGTTVSNSTFSGNSATTLGGGIHIENTTLTLANTIVAMSPSGGNCAGGIINGGNNLDSGSTCGWSTQFQSMSDTDPLMGPLADNGGTTQTHALIDGSPAINRGDATVCSDSPVNGVDQRGVARPQGIRCDIGAVEKENPVILTFADVPAEYWAWSFIERLFNAGITGGCATNPLRYCPDQVVNRAQMAVFLLRGINTASYVPPAVGDTTGFGDVPTTYWAAAWIKQLAADGITTGCGNGNYCPEDGVTRAQMAVFLLRSKHGAAYVPPAVGASTGFSDVPASYWAAAWIKQLVAEGITAGCGTNTYCPEAPVTRAQMAVFLVRTFNLP
jgi:predicted outer membrane repeat protein